LREPPKMVALEGTAAAGTRSSPSSSPAAIAAAPDGGAPASVEAAESARLAWKGPATVKAGEIFAVPIHLVSKTALRGAAMELLFPAQQLEIVEVTEGTFFKQGGGQTSFTHSIDAAQGKVGIGILRGDLTGASGDAPVIELRMRAKAAGEIDLKVSSL